MTIQTIYFITQMSPIHTIRRYLRTTTKRLFYKKIWILRNMVKMHLQTVHHWQQFSQATCEFVRSNEKCLCVLFKDVPLSEDSTERRTKNLFAKHQWKRLYTLIMFRGIFVGSPIFCDCSLIVCSGLYSPTYLGILYGYLYCFCALIRQLLTVHVAV